MNSVSLADGRIIEKIISFHTIKKAYMNTMRIIFAILVVFLLSCNEEKDEVIITGQILEGHPEEIDYTFPINGTSFEGFAKKVKLDSIGQFQINLHVDRPALVNFMILGSPSHIIEPGNSYDLSINWETNEINWNNNEIQEVYSNLPHQHPRSCLYSYGEDFTSYHVIKQKLNNDLVKEISLLNELYNQNKISKDVLNLLITDRKIYYYTAQSVLASRNQQHYNSNNKKVPDEIYKLWSEAAYGVPLDSEFILGSCYSFDYLQMYFFYMIYTTYEINEFTELRAEKRASGTTHAHNIELAKNYFTGNVLEYYIAGTFFDQLRKRQYDENLILLLEQFKNDFPGSDYLPFVEKTYENMIQKQKELAAQQAPIYK
jgi:hypothetical protein